MGDWLEADKETLRRMWPENSARTISNIVGKSRSAVIGMAHRMHLQKKPPGMRQSAKVIERKPTLRPRKTVLYPRGIYAVPPPEAPIHSDCPVSLLEARDDQCRAPLDYRNKEGSVMFCGRPIVEGQNLSFCSEHLARFTTKGYVHPVKGYY